MTTIAASVKEGVMACDSRISVGDVWWSTEKIVRIQGELIGTTGDVKDTQKWFEWYMDGKPGKPPVLNSFEALILRRDGVIRKNELYFVDAHSTEILVERGYHAAGSGAQAAIAVMMLGHDALKAVQIACEIDASSGGKIKSFNLLER